MTIHKDKQKDTKTVAQEEDLDLKKPLLKFASSTSIKGIPKVSSLYYFITQCERMEDRDILKSSNF